MMVRLLAAAAAARRPFWPTPASPMRQRDAPDVSAFGCQHVSNGLKVRPVGVHS